MIPVVQQLISADQVLIGPAGQRIVDGAVLVEDETIRAVGPRADLEAQADSNALHHRSAPGGTVLPGLINAHVHLCWDAGFGFLDRYRAADDHEVLLGVAGRAQQALRAGVTTLRDLGDRNGLALRVRDAIDRGDLVGPRVLGSGPPLTPEGGHCWFLGGEVSGPGAIRERVQRNISLGADVIKVMASGGEMTPESAPTWASQFSAEDLTLVVKDAAAEGLPVAAHAHGTRSIAAAVEAGVSTIEHCSWQGEGGQGPDLRDDLAREIARHGIAACHAYPPDWRSFEQLVVGEERASAAAERVRWMEQHGIRLIPGTDGGLPTSTFNNYVGALTYYTEKVGFSPERVLELATTEAARALGLRHVGQLVPGYAADLLLVDGDPLEDFGGALREQQLILARGCVVTPEAT